VIYVLSVKGNETVEKVTVGEATVEEAIRLGVDFTVIMATVDERTDGRVDNLLFTTVVHSVE
jgi:hypothetical protein